MCLGVFKIFASSVLTHYVLVFCVTLWQPAVLYSVLVLYLRTHSILKWTYIKGCKQNNKNSVTFISSFVRCHITLVQHTRKEIPLKRYCVKLVEWKNYCVHFVFQHAYITLILFRLQQLCVAPVSISEGISRLISPAVANTKTRLKISNSRIGRFENKVKLTGSTHC